VTPRIHVTSTVSGSAHRYFLRDAERLSAILGDAAVTSPEDADAIVFVGSSDPALTDIRRSELYRRHANKCLTFHGGDEPVPALPGIYASIPKRWFDPRYHRGGFYLRASLDATIPSYCDVPPTYLYTFVGAGANHISRRSILSLVDNRGLLVDSRVAHLEKEAAKQRFVDSLRDSAFVLCPRGGGTSSFRVFEAMKAGRVPVIVSDEWVHPQGPDWSACSVQIGEREISTIPERLRALESSAHAMGELARSEFERWFARAAAKRTVIAWTSEIVGAIAESGPYTMAAPVAGRYAIRRLRRMFGGGKGT
jgi:hypothetical protein